MKTAKTYRKDNMTVTSCDICGNPRVVGAIVPTVGRCHLCIYSPLFRDFPVLFTDAYYALIIKWSIR